MSYFNKFTTYKHTNNTDVAIVVLSSYFIPEKEGYKLKVIWRNIVNKNNTFSMMEDKIFIKAKDVKNWKEYKEIITEPTQ